jgi:AcrR family transcriptional regulator
MPGVSPTSEVPPAAGHDPPRKSDRTRQRLISAAAATLSRLGYAGTRLVDVAEQAGLQAPAIYYYFESREKLIEEVMVVGTIQLRTFVEHALETAPPRATPLQRLDVIIDAHLRQLMAEPSFAHAVIRNIGQLPEAIRARQLVEERKYARIWRGVLRDASHDGSLRPGLNPDLAQALIVGTLNWATEWWSPNRGSLETLIATAQSIIQHGVATP